VDLDPHGSALTLVGWIQIPDPRLKCGSGSSWVKRIHKKEKKLSFEVLDARTPVAWRSFLEA
jgi:hypothetical protein